jgi:hypothetical protein
LKNTPTTEKSTSTTTLPAWLNAASENNYNYASNISTAPYTGTGVAGLTPEQLEAIRRATGNVGVGQNALAPAMAANTNAMNFTAPQITTANVTDSVNGLMNPYQSQVVDAANYELERQRVLQQQKLDAQAAASKAFGGDRSGVVQAMNDRDYGTLKAKTTSDLLSAGWDKAVATAMDMAKSNQGASISSAGINLAGAAQGMAGAKSLSDMGWNDVTGLLGAGGVQQANDQAKMSFDYNEFLRQKQAELAKSQAMQGAVAGAKTDTTTNSSTTKDNYSNPIAQALGLGLGALSMFGTGGLSAIPGLLGGGMMGSGAALGSMQIGNQLFPAFR